MSPFWRKRTSNRTVRFLTCSKLRAKEGAKTAFEQLPPVSSVPRTTLPRIQLPNFSGQYEEWPAFRDLFKSLVIKNTSLSGGERLHYLKTNVKSEAEQLIRNLPTTEENFERAWSMLVAYYDNKRFLVRSCYTKFTASPKMKTESAGDLRRLFHEMTSTVGTLESIGCPITDGIDLFVHLVVERLDPRSRRDWKTSISTSSEPPSYDTLKTFLECRMQILEAHQPAKTEAASATGSKPSSATQSARAHIAQKSTKRNGRCTMCQGEHYVLFCTEFQKKTPAQKKEHAEANQLCLNCFGKHKVAECQSKKTCTACKARHHTSTHDAYSTAAVPASATPTSHVQKRPARGLAMLLVTARVDVIDRAGTKHRVRALIDSGSEVSLITESLAQRLRLRRISAPITLFGIGEQRSASANGEVSMRISSTTSDYSLQMTVLPKISTYGSRVKMACGNWQHVHGLQLVDPEFRAADPVDVLLRADVFASIIEEGLRKGEPNWSVAQRMTLGWILTGIVDENEDTVVSSHQCSVDDKHAALVGQFWDQEELPNTPLPLTNEEQKCEDFYTRTHIRTAKGRYMVRLPVTRNLLMLSDTRRAAHRLLLCMERRFQTDADLQNLYGSFMAEYEGLHYMTPVAPLTGSHGRLCYLPHHGVLKTTGNHRKIRVVFNGSSSWLPPGDSLNAFLLTGPNLLPTLPDILLRWRLPQYAMVADIEKMYRQILIHPGDRDLQRILWRADRNKPVQEYQLNTVTYGLACAPYLAVRTLRQLAADEEKQFPKGAAVLRRDCYVDDILTGPDTLEEAFELQTELIHTCLAGGFPLRKWAANSSDLLDHIPVQEAKPECITKRTIILSSTARLFDPLGWLAPVMISAKVIIQTLCLHRLAWDESVAQVERNAWQRIQRELPLLEEVRVPRWLHSTQSSDVELHGFADASQRAYTAAVYARIRSSKASGPFLLAAKTKVALIRQISLPRLELCAADMLTRLVAHVRDAGAGQRNHSPVVGFNGGPRLDPGADNPADCASRGLTPRELLDFTLWWQGPSWLVDEANWPAHFPADVEVTNPPEHRARVLSAVAEHQRRRVTAAAILDAPSPASRDCMMPEMA
ncbi:uncharacterized protein LOC105255167 [Camponotus floridanus]|uniref:uncharacterized protein LOC105255167 n=1 Tax=Camponotus floridanus TaxID=104421 RepID=UPI000DC6729C|nr:uncharacterized protein LOC105255167 [Camponotus floridanus]